MLGRNLFEARERLKVKRKEVEGKSDLIEGLPDFLVEHQIWSRLRKVIVYDEIGQKSFEEREKGHWRCTVSFSA